MRHSEYILKARAMGANGGRKRTTHEVLTQLAQRGNKEAYKLLREHK